MAIPSISHKTRLGISQSSPGPRNIVMASFPALLEASYGQDGARGYILPVPRICI